jgi:UPF0755 protein
MGRPGPPPVPGGRRSAEERERARLEREARRTGEPLERPRATPAPRDRSAGLAAAEERLRGLRGKGRPGGPEGGGPAGGSRTGARIALAVFLFATLLVAWVLVSLFQPLHGDGEGDRFTVAIPRGLGAGEIGDLLEERGVVSSSFFFQLRARLSGQRGDLKSGTHSFRKDMSYGAALDELTKTPTRTTVTVTLPEGKSRREAAGFVKAAGIEGEYVKETERSPGFDPARYDAPRGADLEGFLFPATYELRGSAATAGALVKKQLQAFEENFGGVSMRYARSKNLTEYDVLIIASLIEREVAVPRERRIVASVIYNRLSQGTPLGIDATTRYETDNWTRPIRRSELEADTPYNTRINTGLPPGPIGNPGLASIQAAARPANTDYLFYVAKVCGEGAHEFAETDAEFQRFADRYEQERQRLGRAPNEC